MSKIAKSSMGMGSPHGLPGQLVVSLTSYPARFDSLHLTLRSLLSQTICPDLFVLWIAQGHLSQLPREVRDLECFGLQIRECDDLRSYKKLIPAVENFPRAFVATADDDLYYPTDWLRELIAGVESVPTVICHRAHRISRLTDGRMAPYLEWQFDVQDSGAREPAADVMPTSGAGALYPPGSLDARVTDRNLFERLCPDGDDLWFYWCARMAGTLSKKVGGRMRPITWEGSQESSLWEQNKRGGNDRMIRALEKEFGPLP